MLFFSFSIDNLSQAECDKYHNKATYVGRPFHFEYLQIVLNSQTKCVKIGLTDAYTDYFVFQFRWRMSLFLSE